MSAFKDAAFAFSRHSPAISSSSISYIHPPLDLSVISDPHLVVVLKNLSKRDEITRSKALEDLIRTVSENPALVDDQLLHTWVQIYPRLTIDLSRRIRSLSHSATSSIFVPAGKKVANHLGGIAGAWVTGLKDVDKGAAKAASKAFSEVFPNPDKHPAFFKTFRTDILEFIWNIISRENAKTLSDERHIDPDDAQAKYFRALAAAVAALAGMLNVPASRTGDSFTFDDIFSSSKFWSLASNPDPAVRRAFHVLTSHISTHKRDEIVDHTSLISKVYISALGSNQKGSQVEFLHALTSLAEAVPSVWTSSYRGKTSVAERLVQLVNRSSSDAGPDFWTGFASLIDALSAGVVQFARPTETDAIIDAIWSAITQGKKTPTVMEAAVNTYVRAIQSLYRDSDSSDANGLDNAPKCHLTRLFSEYIDPSSAETRSASAHFPTCFEKCLSVSQVRSQLADSWEEMTDKVAQGLNSLELDLASLSPAQRSWIGEQVQRWTRLYTITQSSTGTAGVEFPLWSDQVQRIATVSAMVLVNTNGGATEAATSLLSVLTRCYRFLPRNGSAYLDVLKYLREHVASILTSPSGKTATEAFYFFEHVDGFNAAWNDMVDQILLASTPKFQSIKTFLSFSNPDLISITHKHAGLQAYLVQSIQDVADEPDHAAVFDLINTIPDVLSQESARQVIAWFGARLDNPDINLDALSSLTHLAESNGRMLADFIVSEPESKLLDTLLYLCDHPDTLVSDPSEEIGEIVKSTLKEVISAGGDLDRVLNIPQKLLNRADARSASPSRIASLIQSVLDDQTEDVAMWTRVLPDPGLWKSSLEPFINRPQCAVLAVTEPLHSVVSLIQPTPPKSDTDTVARDGSGLSVPLRLALYFGQLVKDLPSPASLAVQSDRSCYQCFCLTGVLARIDMNMPTDYPLLSHSTGQLTSILPEFVQLFQTTVSRTSDSGSGTGSPGDELGQFIFSEVSEPTQWAYYNALALVELRPTSIPSDSELVESSAKIPPDFSGLVSLVACPQLCRSPSASKTLNNLVSWLMTKAVGGYSDDNVGGLIMFNAMMRLNPDLGRSVSVPRMVMLSTKLKTALQNEAVSMTVRSELFRALSVLVPVIKATHGLIWEETVECVLAAWNQIADAAADPTGNSIVLAHSSVEYLGVLMSISKEDPDDINSDLPDVLDDQAEGIQNGLIRILPATGSADERSNLAIRQVHELIAGILGQIRPHTKFTGDLDNLFGLLMSQSYRCQSIAFGLLHRIVPSLQEQRSIDIVINKETGRLSSVLQTVIDPSRFDDPDALDIESDTISPLLHGYLVGWKVVFDHFDKASYRLREDYATELKTTGSTSRLLDILVHVLDLTDEKPYQPAGLDPRAMPSGPKAATWELEYARPLAVHLLLLCLERLPLQARSWWVALGRRGTDAARVKAWYQRTVSSIVISDALYDISEWATSMSSSSSSSSTSGTGADPDPAFSVRVNPKGNDITASYVVEDETMSVIFKLPPAYPLEMASVEGGVRVGVSEKRWQSWILASQGMMNFATGSIVDALVTWRKNVVGALKGHSECTICYSVISAQRELPTKKCATCRHLFHSSCIFKWFSSSPGSTCPFCRSHFYTPYAKPGAE